MKGGVLAMKHLRYSISSIAALSVLFILASCGMPSSTCIVPTNHMVRLRAIATDLPARHKVGEVVNIDQIFEITVNKVTTSPGTQFFRPYKGNYFLLVNVSIKNISSENQTIM